MSASIYENILYSLLDIYPFLILIHKHYCDEISCDWYNCQVFIKNRCEIKMIETQSDVIEENIFIENITVQWRKIMIIFYMGTQWI